MDQEDGLIWVYGPGDDGVMAFTDDGIENLKDLVQIHKDDPSILTEQQRALDAFRKPTHDECLSAIQNKGIHPRSTADGYPRSAACERSYDWS